MNQGEFNHEPGGFELFSAMQRPRAEARVVKSRPRVQARGEGSGRRTAGAWLAATVGDGEGARVKV